MDLLSYFRVLRRRWWVIVVCVIAGVGLGWASTVVKSSDAGSSSARAGKVARTYYKATHTFLFKQSNSTNAYPSSYTNLDQIAILATTGPVPDAVAKQLGTGENGAQLAQQITTVTNSTADTLAVIAVDPDSARAAQLADSFSDQLAKQLATTDQDAYQQAIKDANDKLSFLQSKIDGLNAQLAATPPPANAAQLTQQRDSLQNQAADAYGAVQQVTSASAPVTPLATLEQAQSVPIDQDEYRTRLDVGKIGANNLQAGNQVAATPTVVASSSSTLDSTRARLLLGGFLGLLTGIGIAILMERLDRRIRTRADAEAAFALPVLAEVPVLSSKEQRQHTVVAASKPLSPIAEAYRAVRSSLLFQRTALAGSDEGRQTNGHGGDPLFDSSNAPLVVMVTSAAPKDGKTTSSANLAVVFGEAGSSVLVLNCDFRRPMIHEYFGVPDTPRRVHTTEIPGVTVVSNVTDEPDPNPAQVIATQRQVVAAARAQFDVIILDTAPLLSANDALEMASEADVVVLVARSGWSKFPAAERASEMLDRVEAPVVGTILVGAGEPDTGYYSYYQPRERPSKARREDRPATNGSNGNGAADWNLVLSDPGAEEHQGS